MSDPIGASSDLSPRWLAAARDRAAEFGFERDLADLGEARWQVLCQAVELTVAGEGEPPPEWRTTLARQAGRVPAAERRQDAADARLAERGEVFAVDDDASRDRVPRKHTGRTPEPGMVLRADCERPNETRCPT